MHFKSIIGKNKKNEHYIRNLSLMNNEDYTRTLLTKYGFLSQTGRDSFPFIRSTAKTNHLKVFNFLKLFRGIKFLKDRHLQLSITCVRLVLSHSCVNKFHLGKKKN